MISYGWTAGAAARVGDRSMRLSVVDAEIVQEKRDEAIATLA
jgi:hypothetical protein